MRGDDNACNIQIVGGVSNVRKYLSARSDGKGVKLAKRDDKSGRQQWIFKPISKKKKEDGKLSRAMRKTLQRLKRGSRKSSQRTKSKLSETLRKIKRGGRRSSKRAGSKMKKLADKMKKYRSGAGRKGKRYLRRLSKPYRNLKSKMKNGRDRISKQRRRRRRRSSKGTRSKMDQIKKEMQRTKREEKRQDRKLDKMGRDYWQVNQKEPKSPMEIDWTRNVNAFKFSNRKQRLKDKMRQLRKQRRDRRNKARRFRRRRRQRRRKNRQQYEKQRKEMNARHEQILSRHRELMNGLKQFLHRFDHLTKQVKSQEIVKAKEKDAKASIVPPQPAPPQPAQPQYFINPSTPQFIPIFPQNYANPMMMPPPPQEKERVHIHWIHDHRLPPPLPPPPPPALPRPLLTPPFPPVPHHDRRRRLIENGHGNGFLFDNVRKCVHDVRFGELCMQYDEETDVISFDVMVPKYERLKTDKNVLKEVMEYGEQDRNEHHFVYLYDIDLNSKNVECGEYGNDIVPLSVCLMKDDGSGDVTVYFVEANAINETADNLVAYVQKTALVALNWNNDVEWDEIIHFDDKKRIKRCVILGLTRFCMEKHGEQLFSIELIFMR